MKIVSYVDVLRHKVSVGKSVAVIGAGGIGYDVSDFLTHPHNEGITLGPEGQNPLEVDEKAVDAFLQDWHIDRGMAVRGGLTGDPTKAADHFDQDEVRQIFLFAREES